MDQTNSDQTKWKFAGVCHKFGDDLRHDGVIMQQKYVTEKVFDPEILKTHVLEDDYPDFRAKVKPGDIVVAGKNFGKGKAHVQGYIGLRALGVGVLCESMPFLSYRGAISVGLIFLADCEGVAGLANDGDRVEANFFTGEFTNLTAGKTTHFAPMPDALRDIVAQGGSTEVLRKWWHARKASQAEVAA
jgi:3-isopropylmalate/(R)-2-methylmalate dehydratase small subunit